MRQELAAMGKSYDATLEGQYIGTMASVYKAGADKVDSLMWQYANADAQAQKAKDIQTVLKRLQRFLRLWQAFTSQRRLVVRFMG